MDVGIDLGTTFSVLAVQGKVALADGYPEGWYLEECDVTIIPSPDGDKTFPSVLWINPDDPDDVLIGYDAKQKAEDGDAPIMFSKRAMGTDQVLQVNKYQLSAKDVAARMLKYLKRCAEDALGEPVERAVITHPAYFDPNQIAETREACELAGFSMSQPEQLMMEPAAAALAYLQGLEEDAVKIMTYDLGGGTFDVTVLERREGVVSMRAFDGDALLGGYNFDRALVRWMLMKLREKGRDIPHDPEKWSDRAIRAWLLMIAEAIKIKLAEQRTDHTKVPVRVPNTVVDRDGKVVPIQEQISRAEYTTLIQDDLDKTIEACNRALSKADMQAEDLDMILLVGGSTFGPWVSDALADAFPEARVEQLDPDSCVAAGAAIQAAELPPLGLGSGLRLVLDVPKKSALPSIDVTGTVTADDGSGLPDDLLSGLSVYLTAVDGSTPEPQSLGADGAFLFEDVELDESGASQFGLKIADAEGLPRLTHEFAVEYDEDQRTTEIFNVLPKQIRVKTARGLVPIAEEGVELPAKISESFTRLFDEQRLVIPVFVEDDEIGEIVVDDIPEEAGRGSQVQLDIEITRHNELRGFAKVLTRAGVEAARSKIRVLFPPVQMQQLSELELRFDELQAEREDEEFNCQDPAQRTLLAGKGKKLVRKIATLFTEQEPDRQEIQAHLRDLRKIVHPPSDDMDPPRSTFMQIVEAVQALVDSLGSSPEAISHADRLLRVQREGDDAYAARNSRRWTRANENIQTMLHRLRQLNDGDGGDDELPPTELLKDQFLQMLDQHRGELETRRSVLLVRDNYQSELKPRLDKIEDRIDAMAAKVDRISDDIAARQALAQLQTAVRGSDKLSLEVQEVDAAVR